MGLGAHIGVSRQEGIFRGGPSRTGYQAHSNVEKKVLEPLTWALFHPLNNGSMHYILSAALDGRQSQPHPVPKTTVLLKPGMSTNPPEAMPGAKDRKISS